MTGFPVIGTQRRGSASESGQAAGAEAIVFGLLVFVVATLLIANAWAVIDAKMAMSAAAREASRAFAEAPPGTDPMAAATEAAREAVRGHGRDPNRLVLRLVSGDFTRCSLVRFEARYDVAAVSVPWVGGHGHGFTAASRHAEIVDPYRDGVPDSDAAGSSIATPDTATCG